MTVHTVGWSGRSRLWQLFLSHAHERPLPHYDKDHDTSDFHSSTRFQPTNRSKKIFLARIGIQKSVLFSEHHLFSFKYELYFYDIDFTTGPMQKYFTVVFL